MKKKIGILNSGGDCPALNTVIDGVVKSLESEYELLGFYRGYEGLLDKKYIPLNGEITNNSRWIGGTILKSVNKGRFPSIRSDEGSQDLTDEQKGYIKQAFENYKELGLEGLVVLGGDGTLYTAYRMQEFGFKIIGVPKSIDNDLNSTDYTFGFQTAVEIASDAVDRLRTTAASHDRIMVLEVMGRTAGWIALHSGISGGADIILIPEIPFSYSKVREFLQKKHETGNTSSIIVVSEAALSTDGAQVFKEWASEGGQMRFGGIAEEIARFINDETDMEARAVSLGHIQRGGSPNSFDRVLATQLGAFAAELVRQGKFGKMAAFKANQVVAVDMSDAVLELKLVSSDSQIIKLARDTGISFGD
jgi:ATP-dependent phosphofructokinase / diphosphate-dependent phosphofructokinase